MKSDLEFTFVKCHFFKPHFSEINSHTHHWNVPAPVTKLWITCSLSISMSAFRPKPGMPNSSILKIGYQRGQGHLRSIHSQINLRAKLTVLVDLHRYNQTVLLLHLAAVLLPKVLMLISSLKKVFSVLIYSFLSFSFLQYIWSSPLLKLNFSKIFKIRNFSVFHVFRI